MHVKIASDICFGTLRRGTAFGLLTLLVFLSASAKQVDIQGPTDSVAFGTAVAVLPNGNIVVTDSQYGAGTNIGAVYLYSPSGAQISALTGSTQGDEIGNYGVTVLANGDFVVCSPQWSNGVATAAGAVTQINGDSGLNGAVSAANSLVGDTTNDSVGNACVTLLSNGNYVVGSYLWNNGVATVAGAVTWVDASKGLTGAVSPENSLVGAAADEGVGASLGVLSVTALKNGNYVVISPGWNRLARGPLGAAMWVNGSLGATGEFSTSNSLVGGTAGDSIGSGGVFALSNGNYVVASPDWNNGDIQSAGAVTWVNGNSGLVATVSKNNSLVGSSFLDSIGAGNIHSIVALTNGNYVVASPYWSNGDNRSSGAVTWGNGTSGTTGVVSPQNSLVGTTELDYVGYDQVKALRNGNYVVASSFWHNGAVDHAGAATWGDGATGTSGVVSVSNSLVGTTQYDEVGRNGTAALTNGNFVVASGSWHGVGAATWGDGTKKLTGLISAQNSLTGSSDGDGVGAWGVAALSNGNYVVQSPFWNNGPAMSAGAATWANGNTGMVGVVSTGNSLVGSSTNDQVGYNFSTALANGNYFVASPGWSSNSSSVGAVTWGNGASGISGTISAENSVTGISASDSVGGGFDHDDGIEPLGNGDYIFASPSFDNGAIVDAGAITIGRHGGGTVGPINAFNSVIGTVTGGGEQMVYAYDATRDTLIVGQPAANIVSLFKADLLFTSGFQ